MKRLLEDIPRRVLIAAGVLLGSLVSFLVGWVFLQGALDDAESANRRMIAELSQLTKNINQDEADKKYVEENLQKFEALLKSDRLVPHTRRAAILELENVARRTGISKLSYSFSAAPANSATAVSAQPASGGYKLSVEAIDLKLGAPLDGDVYRFVDEISNSFPGSAVVDTIQLSRAPEITAAALEALSRGLDSSLVEGEVKLTWRTAEAQEKDSGKK